MYKLESSAVLSLANNAGREHDEFGVLRAGEPCQFLSCLGTSHRSSLRLLKDATEPGLNACHCLGLLASLLVVSFSPTF